MASYPTEIYDPRTKENKAGVVYDPNQADVGYAEDVTKLDDEVVAMENELGVTPKTIFTDVRNSLDNKYETDCRYIHIIDDFATANMVVANYGMNAWGNVASNGGYFEQTEGEENHPGIMRMRSTSTGYATQAIFLGSRNNNNRIIQARQIDYVEFIIKSPDWSKIIMQVGVGRYYDGVLFGDDSLLAYLFKNSSDYLKFYVKEGGASNGGITTEINPVNDEWLHIIIKQNSSNYWEMYVNGTLVGTEETLSPDDIVQPIIYMRSQMYVGAILSIDYFRLKSRQLTR